jgi:hypothetical protein
MDAAESGKLVRNLAERRKIWKRRAEILPLAMQPLDLESHIKTLSKSDLQELSDLDERSARLAAEAATLWAR